MVVEEGVEETKQDKVESQRDLTPAFMAQCVLPVCIQREKNQTCHVRATTTKKRRRRKGESPD